MTLHSQLARAALAERASHEIDADWIKGIRKGWRLMVAKTKRYPDRYDKATDIDFDKLQASAKGAMGALDELIEYVARLRADLLINKGLWTTQTTTRGIKGLPVDFSALKAKTVAALSKAEDGARDTRSRVRFWSEVLTPETSDYRMDGGRRRAEAADSIEGFQRYVNSVFLAVEEGVDVADRAISVMLDGLRDALSKAPETMKFMGQSGHGEPDIVHVGGATVFFADAPEATDRPTGRIGSAGKPWLPTGPKSRSSDSMRASPRAPQYRRDYIEQMKQAEALLRQRGLGFLWYGRFSVHCKECGGENPHGPEFGVGAAYYRQGDYVAIYSDAYAQLYRLIAHELGHRYYYKFMSMQDRADFDKFFGQVKATSRYGGMATEEDFAEVFADYVDGKDLSRDQIERFKQFIKGKRKQESMQGIHNELASALTEKSGERRYKLHGKKGVWRTSKHSHKIFIPDDGSGPMMNPKIKSGDGGKRSSNAGGGGGGSSDTKASDGWLAKLKHAAHKAGEKLVEPIHMVRKLIKDPKARSALKKRMITAFHKEGEETKQLVGTINRALHGKKISHEERVQAINQTADILKATILAGGVAHLFSAGILKALAAIATPLDELAGVALDVPLRALTKKVFGVEHGILPSAFYEEGSPGDVIDQLIDAILDELAGAAKPNPTYAKSEASDQLAAAMA